MEEPEPALIRAAAAGDQKAFAELVRAYQAQVWRFLRHLLGDPALAEDVTQETFIRVFLKLRTFHFRSKFSTWVFSVARNAGIDAIRSRNRRSRLAEGLVPLTPTSGGADRSLEVEMAVATLSPKLREAFLLVEVVGLRYREAAAALRVPEGTVKSRVFHARSQLIAWMRADGEDADEM
jgi:RNA polymerase sigma-70 factor (ECF subfamily)